MGVRQLDKDGKSKNNFFGATFWTDPGASAFLLRGCLQGALRMPSGCLKDAGRITRGSRKDVLRMS